MKNNIKKVQTDSCYGCQACSNVCPHNCISMIENENGFLVPHIDELKCTKCSLCLHVCPAKNIKRNTNNTQMAIYAANAKDEYIRKNSTSGGLFYPIADYVIKHGGDVYGAAFDEQYNVIHICAENLDEVKRCMKSKYVQSDMNKVYRQIAEQSKTKLVMFSGTPCQVAAVSNYPNINRENLILIDVVCHGVSSPRLWRKYLAEKESKYGKICNIKIRDKQVYGCLQSETIIQFDNGTEYRRILDNDEYMKAFMKGFSLRDRCYNCHYKGRNRKSDLTIGDFTTVKSYVKEADSFKGTSMLIINSKKGNQIIDKLRKELELHRIYSKKVLLADWTWGLSYPYKKQNEYFFNICFKQNKSIDRSVKRTTLYLKRKEKTGENERIKERILGIKAKVKKTYYTYFFKL